MKIAPKVGGEKHISQISRELMEIEKSKFCLISYSVYLH